jgi:hypothetical protein
MPVYFNTADRDPEAAVNYANAIARIVLAIADPELNGHSVLTDTLAKSIGEPEKRLLDALASLSPEDALRVATEIDASVPPIIPQALLDNPGYVRAMLTAGVKNVTDEEVERAITYSRKWWRKHKEAPAKAAA